MKKFYLLMLSMIMAVAANAANWYISGAFQGWSHCQAAYQLKETSTGVFTLELPAYNGSKSISGGFVIVQGTVNSPDWNNKIGSNGAKVVADTPYKYVKGGGDFSMDGTVEDAVITLDTNAGTLLISGKAKENEYTTVYLVGDLGSSTGWNDSRTDFPMTLKSGTQDTWTAHYTFTNANNYFKMRAGNNQYSTGGNDITVTLGTSYTATTDGGNSFVLPAGEYDFTFVLPYNAETGTLTVTGESSGGGGGDNTGDFSSWYVNVLGPFNNWTDNGVQPVDGISTTTDLAIGTKGFKIKVWPGGGSDVYYVSDGSAIATDTWVQLYQDAYNADPIQIEGATEDAVYTVKFNCATNEVFVTLTSGGGGTVDPEPDPTGYDVYVVGGANGWDLAGETYKFERQGETNVYTLTSDAAFAQEWKIRIDPTNWDLTFGAGDGLVMAPNTDLDAWCGSSKNFQAIDGTVTMTFTLVDGSYESYSSTPSILNYTVEGGTIEPTYPENMYVIGEVNGGQWDPASGLQMVNEGDGFYTLENVQIDNYFALTSVLGTWDDVNANRFGPATSGAAAEEGENDASGTGNTSWQIATPGVYNMYFSYDDKILELEAVEVSEPDPMDQWWVVLNGDFNGWSTDGGIQSKDGIYEFKEVKIGSGDFEINIWNGVQNLYFGTPDPIALSTTTTVTQNGGHMTLAEGVADKEYNVTFDYNKGTILIDLSTGLENIDADNNAPVEYFNLQGVRVDKPENGVYIMRQAGKTTKVIK